MAYRFTNTEKWSDSWFSELKPIQKLLFIYLCDNCDIAGFIEFTKKKFAFELGLKESEIIGAIEGLSRGLIFSKLNDCIYIRNFLKHQKNLPLNSNNNAHLGIIKRFENYKNKFDIDNIDNFINQTVEPLSRGLGKGKGKGNDNGIDNDKGKSKFKIPEISEIKEYCFLRKNNIDAETFYNFYQSKGWMVGKSKMKDWKACIITWEKSNNNQTNNSISNGKRRNNVDSLAKQNGGYGEL